MSSTKKPVALDPWIVANIEMHIAALAEMDTVAGGTTRRNGLDAVGYLVIFWLGLAAIAGGLWTVWGTL